MPMERPSDQKSQPFETPPRDQIPGISRMHVQAMEAGIDEAWGGGGMVQLMLTTRGRKSGNEHKVALPYWVDESGEPIVVGSFSGAPSHPAWYVNMADRAANPEVLVRMKERAYWSNHEILDGDDYTRTWAQLTVDRPFYNDYQANTARRIPLIRLRETRPA